MTNIEQPFHGDRPIELPGDDRLGFGPAAKHVADAIHRMASPDGFVIGIEGEWGSGKSSFTNLVLNNLRRSNDSPEIIRFLPWLISSRDLLLKELFSEIQRAAVRIEANDVVQNRWGKFRGKVWSRRYSAEAIRKRRIKNLFSRFSSRLVQAGKLAELFGAVGAGVVAEAGKRSVDEWLANASLDKEKASIQEELRRLSRKIVILIDDLDRLEPTEVVEVLRLVRAVVDFPNVVFVLCYSRGIIAKNISTLFQGQSGDEFLEKIIQISFPVPQPEAFDLRRMFRHELQLLYPNLLIGDTAIARSVRDRLAEVIDEEGGRALLTPRHVVRAINALRFHASPVLDDIDMPDMVWLQLIRMQSPELHKWVEGYLIGFEAKHNGARISDESASAELIRLNSILEEMSGASSSRDARKTSLISILPGVEYGFHRVNGEQKFSLEIYKNEDNHALVKGRRLGSPQHYRYYFSLSAPKNSISDREFSIFLESSQFAPDAAATQLKSLASIVIGSGRVASQVLLDRLKGGGIKDVPGAALPGILQALAESMDVAALKAGEGEWGIYWVWREATKVAESIFGEIDNYERMRLTKELFGGGKAIGWLTDIFRTEVFSHGIHGASQKPEAEWLLSEAELKVAGEELLHRYRGLTALDLGRLPRIAPLLFAWMQYEPESIGEIRKKVSEISQENDGFLDFLHKMRSWQATNGEVHYPLKESSLSNFMDIDQVRERLMTLAAQSDSPNALQAKELLRALVSEDR